jgi:bloom syndrome protein
MLRREFPGVPLMALTATANEKVVNDAIRALAMRNEHRYVSSFNRPNLCYEVRKKDGKTIDEIADYISNRPKDSGVIYCLSRKDCETLAGKLQEKIGSKPGCNRVKVSFYHADLDASERERRHRDWSNGIISVLCATIAFGMGIDKPDVRYVIHYSMPKSITHYYQESGRAGRDREEADCILYYNYKDKRILEHMIIKSSNDPYGQATRRKIDQLYTCVRYCEDAFRCRRTMQLEFFGEHFDRAKCNKTCDNCKAQREPDRRDLTNEAKVTIQLLGDVSNQKRGNGVTLVQLMELFRGTKSQSSTRWINIASLRGYGVGSKYKKHEVDRIFHAMVFDRLLQESSEQNKGGFTSDYVKLGENAAATESGRRKFFVDFPKDSPKPRHDEENKTKRTTANKKKSNTKKSSSEPKKPKAVSSSKAGLESMVFQIDDSSDDENHDGDTELDVKPASSGNRSEAPSILPQAATKELVSRFKTLATNWAEEERLLGNASFYWNILSNESMKTIAAQAPMSIDELNALGVVGENIIKEYGERIVRAVQSFVTQQGLEEYINRRPTKRAKVVSEESNDLVDDEFDDARIDFASIQLPEPTVIDAAKKSKKASPYFT